MAFKTVVRKSEADTNLIQCQNLFDKKMLPLFHSCEGDWTTFGITRHLSLTDLWHKAWNNGLINFEYLSVS